MNHFFILYNHFFFTKPSKLWANFGLRVYVFGTLYLLSFRAENLEIRFEVLSFFCRFHVEELQYQVDTSTAQQKDSTMYTPWKMSLQLCR